MSASYLAERTMRTQDGCAIWLLTPDNQGYGRAKIQGSRPTAHRLSYEVYVEPVNDGWDVHHLCGNRLCVNPEHLIQLSHSDHASQRTWRPTHCKHGHPFDEANTYVTRVGKHQCRACDRGRKALANRGGSSKEGKPVISAA
jgi:hypothetical protein